MKKSVSIVLIILCVAAAFGNPPLKFNENGEFKIVQFTDNHYKWGKNASNVAVECIASVLDAENPDFVIFTGDMVYSKNVENSIGKVLEPVVERGVPFAFVFGNHDPEFELSHGEIYDILASTPGSVMPQRGDVDSPDYIVEVKSGVDPEKTASVFYCLDSHSGAKIPGCGKYAWLDFPQIAWYKSQSDSIIAHNGGTPLPSLMFFHIPLPEIDYANDDGKTQVLGSKGEAVCSPKLNTGMFAAIKEQGDVKGVFFGHDHDNDYVADYYGVLLAYGRYSGGNTVYNHIGTNGGRVILLREGSDDLSTWIRLRTGEKINEFPVKKKK